MRRIQEVPPRYLITLCELDAVILILYNMHIILQIVRS